MIATVRLPALLLIISYEATVVSASRRTSDCFCSVYPAMIVGSRPSARYAVGAWSFAPPSILAELLLISGSGLKARAFGDPAVHGPSNRQ